MSLSEDRRALIERYMLELAAQARAAPAAEAQVRRRLAEERGLREEWDLEARRDAASRAVRQAAAAAGGRAFKRQSTVQPAMRQAPERERARREVEERARRAAEERARREAAAEAARERAEERASREAAERARHEAEAEARAAHETATDRQDADQALTAERDDLPIFGWIHTAARTSGIDHNSDWARELLRLREEAQRAEGNDAQQIAG